MQYLAPMEPQHWMPAQYTIRFYNLVWDNTIPVNHVHMEIMWRFCLWARPLQMANYQGVKIQKWPHFSLSSWIWTQFQIEDPDILPWWFGVSRKRKYFQPPPPIWGWRVRSQDKEHPILRDRRNQINDTNKNIQINSLLEQNYVKTLGVDLSHYPRAHGHGEHGTLQTHNVEKVIWN